MASADEITEGHDVIKVFRAALLLPVAVLCGRETLPKIQPALRVYDYDKTQADLHIN